MIAIAANHRGQVDGRPFIEIFRVSAGDELALVMAVGPFALAARPFVEGFVHHQKTHAVAQIEKFRRRRIMAGADGVGAHLPEQIETALPDFNGNRRTQRAGVLVKTDALELHRLPVERETLIGIEMKKTNANRKRMRIDDLARQLNVDLQAIEIGIVGGPEMGIGNRQRFRKMARILGRQNEWPSRAGDFLSVCVQQRVNESAGVIGCIVIDINSDHHLRFALADLRRCDDDVVRIDAKGVGSFEEDVTINSRARIPPGICHGGMIDTDGKLVRNVAEVQIFIDLVLDRQIAIGCSPRRWPFIQTLELS